MLNFSIPFWSTMKFMLSSELFIHINLCCRRVVVNYFTSTDAFFFFGIQKLFHQ